MWMKITNHYKVIGLSRKKNQEFRSKEIRFHVLYLKFFNFFLLISCIIFNAQLFFVSYGDINIYIYITVNSVHIIHTCFYAYYVYQLVYTISIFFVTVLIFLFKKFSHITKQIAKLKNEQSIDNRKLSKLIYDFNFVYLEMVKMNEYFCKFTGFNFVHFILYAIVLTFVTLSIDNLQLQILIFTVLILLYILTILMTSKIANLITNKVIVYEL